MKYLIIAVAALLLLFPLSLFLASDATAIKVNPAVTVIGQETPVRLEITNPHGVREVAAHIEQNGQSFAMPAHTRPSHRIFFLREHRSTEDVILTLGKKNAPALKDGKAHIVIEAKANDFRGKTDTTSFDVTVVTAQPHVSADGAQHYINQGGSELVVFTPSGYWTEGGAEVGKNRYRSFPLPGHDGQYFSLFAYPWDTPVTTVPRVYVSNPGGAIAYASFWTKITPKKFRARDIVIDNFIEKVVNNIEPQGSGDLLQRFLRINGDMRRKNNETISGLRFKTSPTMLWSGAFLPLVDAAVESQFADRRTYIYKGKKVDEQTHLGFDLAKVANTPIPASNDGKVVWAENLGIYGNCVVIDHGIGLQSIYGHLSRIDVHVGDAVKRGQIIGLSGATGMAAGDHLHYSMQVDGVEVNPIEWWDAHWIHDRVMAKLNPTAAVEPAKLSKPVPAHAKGKRRR